VSDEEVLSDLEDLEKALRRAVSQVFWLRRRLRGYRYGGESTEPRELTPDEWQDVSARLGVNMHDSREAMARVNLALGLTSAQERLLQYLRRHINQAVPGEALHGVAAIHEWARRLRELRVEHGWPIESGVNRSDLGSDEYRLIADVPDADLAQRWRTAKDIRGLAGSGKARLLQYLTVISPGAADQEQLFYVARITAWQRRIRELEEEGWDVRSNIDEPSLPPGTYRLASRVQGPARARQAIRLRYEVLERDEFTCRDCGAVRGTPGVRLEVHHKQMVSQGGDNDPENLITLCDGCHAGRHAVARGVTRDELMDPSAENGY
jgi:HNH endonuclease